MTGIKTSRRVRDAVLVALVTVLGASWILAQAPTTPPRKAAATQPATRPARTVSPAPEGPNLPLLPPLSRPLADAPRHDDDPTQRASIQAAAAAGDAARRNPVPAQKLTLPDPAEPARQVRLTSQPADNDPPEKLTAPLPK